MQQKKVYILLCGKDLDIESDIHMKEVIVNFHFQ